MQFGREGGAGEATTAPDDPFAHLLLSGERIEWHNRPKGGVLFTTGDLFLVPFSLMWATGAMAGLFSGLAEGGGFPLMVGLLFGVMAVYITVGRFAIDAWLRSRTRYAMTDRRVLIVRKPPFGTTTVLAIDRLPDLRFKEQMGGYGTIQFGADERTGRGMTLPALSPTPQFLAIDDAREVFRWLQERGASASP